MKHHWYSMMMVVSGSFANAAYAFIAQLFLVRALSVDNFGQIATVLALINIAVPLAIFGVNSYWLRIFGVYGWGALPLVKASLQLVIVTTMLALVTILLLGYLAFYDSLLLIIYLSPVLIASTGQQLVCSRFQLEGKFVLFSLLHSSLSLIRMLIAGIALLFGWGIVAISYTYGAASTALLLVIIYLLIQLLQGKLKLEGHTNKQVNHIPNTQDTKITSVAYESWPFALGAIFSLVYLQSDIVIVGMLEGNKAAGLYAAAATIMAAVYLLPVAIFGNYLWPKLHRWAECNKKLFLEAYRFGNAASLLSGLSLAFIIFFIAPLIVEVVFGEQYTETVFILQILALCIPMRFIAASVGGVLLTKENMRRKVWYQGIVALLNIVLTVSLIPYFHVLGAAVATVISETLLMALYIRGAFIHVFGRDAVIGWHLDWRRLSA